MAVWRAAIVVMVLALVPVAASGQAREASRPVVWDVAREVLLDPTTYAPAVISYEAIQWDWKTSQVLFTHGWVEANPRFTISGRANDVPVTYAAGRRIIRGTALTILQYSVVNNVAAGISARLLETRYPSHKKLIRTLCWIERIGFASFMTYRNSADHIRQARTNRRITREYRYIAP
jgi:hypothetical protein